MPRSVTSFNNLVARSFDDHQNSLDLPAFAATSPLLFLFLFLFLFLLLLLLSLAAQLFRRAIDGLKRIYRPWLLALLSRVVLITVEIGPQWTTV